MTKNFSVRVFDVIIAAVLFLALAAGGVAVFQYRTHFPGPIGNSASDWGTAGDFFGGMLNPIFAFLSLIAILVTIRFQAIQFSSSLHQLSEANEHGRKQSFEFTFFNMVNARIEYLKSMESPTIECSWGEASRTNFYYILSNVASTKESEYATKVMEIYRASWMCANFSTAFAMYIALFQLVEETFPADRFPHENRKFVNFLLGQFSINDQMLTAYMLIAGVNKDALPTIRKFGILRGSKWALVQSGDRFMSKHVDADLFD